jgi:16S rRNA (cytosine967-C5)-methyltransferase
VAFQALTDVFQNDAYVNIALNEAMKKNNLEDRDAGLVKQLVFGTVSKRLTLDFYLQPYVKKTKAWVKTLLAMTVYQMVYMDKIPTSAAVDEAVKIAKKQGDARLAGFVNAVLRNFSRNPLRSLDELEPDKVAVLSVQYSVPRELVQHLLDQFHLKKTVAILESLETPSKASIRVNLNRATMTEIMNEFPDLEPSQVSPVGLVAPSGNYANTDAFRNGKITIQDESSQLVALAVAPEPNDNILDACAAPGGKTVHMAEFLENGQITALDIYDHKLALVRDNARRLYQDEKIRTQKMDAREVGTHFQGESFDKILVDAPCSGIGLMRRKPDIKYRKEATDYQNLQAIQLEILDSCALTLKNHGTMVYSTCTIFDEENFQVVEKFLASHPNFKQVPLTHEREDLVTDGCIYITPDLYQTDGFFIAKFEKVED